MNAPAGGRGPARPRRFGPGAASPLRGRDRRRREREFGRPAPPLASPDPNLRRAGAPGGRTNKPAPIQVIATNENQSPSHLLVPERGTRV